jgi:hypothetical protein
MTKRPTTKAKLLETTAPPLEAPEIDWDAAVAEGKRLVAEGKRLVAEANATADRNDWRIAELADQVVAVYKEHKLAEFAAAIGLAHCTVKRRRTTYRNWKEILKGDPGLLLSLSYSVARALEKHPDQERLIRENPKMTKRQAEALMKAHDARPESKAQRHWKDLIARAHKAMKDESFLDADRQILLKVIKPRLLNDLREGAKAWNRLADMADKLFVEPADDEFDEPAGDEPADAV